jgi:hypothetical protein
MTDFLKVRAHPELVDLFLVQLPGELFCLRAGTIRCGPAPQA